jgi:hypothetical protein
LSEVDTKQKERGYWRQIVCVSLLDSGAPLLHLGAPLLHCLAPCSVLGEGQKGGVQDRGTQGRCSSIYGFRG